MTSATSKLKISDVAERTGVAAATIRMWEQRYGFPEPERTPSGYRLYTEEDVEAIRTVTALRRRGLSIAVAVDRARDAQPAEPDVNPSIYAAVAALDPGAHPRVLRRSTLAAMSHAIEDELLARGARGFVTAAFQRERFYSRVGYRYEQIARRSDSTLVFADFPDVDRSGTGSTRIPISPTDALGNEWAVVVDSPTYAACLVAWERPNRAAGSERMFEAVLTLDPRAARRATEVGIALTRRRDAELADELAGKLAGRPPAADVPASSLTSLTNRMVAYLDEA